MSLKFPISFYALQYHSSYYRLQAFKYYGADPGNCRSVLLILNSIRHFKAWSTLNRQTNWPIMVSSHQDRPTQHAMNLSEALSSSFLSVEISEGRRTKRSSLLKTTVWEIPKFRSSFYVLRGHKARLYREFLYTCIVTQISTQWTPTIYRMWSRSYPILKNFLQILAEIMCWLDPVLWHLEYYAQLSLEPMYMWHQN